MYKPVEVSLSFAFRSPLLEALKKLGISFFSVLLAPATMRERFQAPLPVDKCSAKRYCAALAPRRLDSCEPARFPGRVVLGTTPLLCVTQSVACQKRKGIIGCHLLTLDSNEKHGIGVVYMRPRPISSHSMSDKRRGMG